MRFSSSTLAALALLSFATLHPLRADGGPSHFQKAEAAAAKKDFDGAIAELDAVLVEDKNNADAHIGRAMMLWQKQQQQAAIDEVGSVIELNPKNGDAFKLRASFYQGTGEMAKAEADYITYLTLTPSETANLQVKAQDEINKASWEDAVNDWTLLAKIKPDDATVLYGKGMALKGAYPLIVLNNLTNPNGQTQISHVVAATTASFLAAIKADPKFVPAYVALDDRIYIEQGLQLLPDNADLLVAHADTLLRSLPSDQAIKTALSDTDHALQINPKYAAAYAGRARAYFWSKQYDQSLAASTKSLELKPDNFDVISTRASIYGIQKDYEKQAAEYGRAMALKPDDAEVAFNRYIALSNLADKTRALDAIGQLIKNQPDNKTYRQSRAELLFGQKKNALALADVNKILALEPENKDAAYLRAKIVAAQK